MVIVVALFAPVGVWAGGTNCTMMCNDPVCKSVCEAACLPPRCVIQCTNDKRYGNEDTVGRVCFQRREDVAAAASMVVNRCPTSLNCAAPVCRTRCPSDVPPTDEEVTTACPACETVCDPPVCVSSAGTCEIVCEQPQCGWKCRKPRDDECPPLICERQCELPACEYSAGTRLAFGMTLSLVWLGAAFVLL